MEEETDDISDNKTISSCCTCIFGRKADIKNQIAVHIGLADSGNDFRTPCGFPDESANFRRPVVSDNGAYFRMCRWSDDWYRTRVE